MPDKTYISKISLGGVTYDLKDAEARELISHLRNV
jgi:hypothetical protein